MDTLLGRTCCILYERALVLDEFGSSSQPEKDIICRSLRDTFNWLVELLNSLMVRATSAKADHKIPTQAITLLRQVILIKEKVSCYHLIQIYGLKSVESVITFFFQFSSYAACI